MDHSAEALERFNRKERNLLIRDALGHSEKPLALSATFRQRVANALNIADGIPADAWWATDYHISWLAGALAIYSEGENARDQVRDNPSREESRLVEGNQEDVDLVIAFSHHLIFIEAKAYGSNSNKQLHSKLARLDLLHAFYEGLANRPDHGAQFHFLLISPHEPKKLVQNWPEWTGSDKNPPWIKLDLDTDSSVLNVTRCSPNGTSSKEGTHWRVLVD